MKVWEAKLREKKPSVLSNGWFGRYIILADTWEEAEQKLRDFIKEEEMENETTIGTICFLEDVTLE